MPIERTCEYCEKIFHVKPYLVRIGKAKYCNKDCFNQALRNGAAKKGENHPLYGKPRPVETRKKISKSLQGEKHPYYGKHFSEEHRGKISKAHIGQHVGEKNWNWKGGISPEARNIRNSLEYKQWRLAVYRRDNCECVKCGNGDGIHAHHILSFKDYPEERFAVDNGITTCDFCHYDLHGWDKGSLVLHGDA